MPLVGASKAAGDVIDVVSMDNSGLNGNDLMANGTGNGYDNKKQKSTDNKTKLATGNDNSRNRKQLNKDSVLIVITEIPKKIRTMTPLKWKT